MSLRVVSLLPSATEIVCALGAGSALVGRSHECDHPAAVVRNLPACTQSNFADGKSPFEGMEGYPGTGIDHINLLVDYLFDAGMKGSRWPLPKIVLSAPG